MTWGSTRRQLACVLALAQLSIGAAAPADDDFRRGQPAGSVSWVLRWNQIAIDASGADHEGPREQLGPGRSSRAIAIVHIAIFDALNAAIGGYESYTGLARVHSQPSLKATVAQAAHATLVAMFPAQTATFDSALAEDLAKVRDRRARTEGVRLGRRAAAAILSLRANDGSQHAEPLLGDYVPGDAPGVWRQEPTSSTA